MRQGDSSLKQLFTSHPGHFNKTKSISQVLKSCFFVILKQRE